MDFTTGIGDDAGKFIGHAFDLTGRNILTRDEYAFIQAHAYLLLAHCLARRRQTNRFPGKDCFSDVGVARPWADAMQAGTYTKLAQVQANSHRCRRGGLGIISPESAVIDVATQLWNSSAPFNAPAPGHMGGTFQGEHQMAGKVLFQFPGQGSQAVGMGGALADAFPAARAVFDEVNEALNEDLFALMQNGPEEDLRLTRNAQPALFAASMAAVAVLREATGKPVHEMADFVAGHSLGEYSALAAAGTLATGDAAKLLRLRGDSMQSAVPPGDGAMAAILGADEAMIDDIVAESAAAGVIQLANDNAPGQIVVSGAAAAVDHAIEAAKARGIRRAIKLPVSAPFHCAMMQPAAEAMAAALQDADMTDASVPVLCNVTAAGEADAGQLRANLVTQVTGRVRWRETLLTAQAEGVTRFVELGTGKVLSGLVKRTLEDVAIVNLDGADDLDSVLTQL